MATPNVGILTTAGKALIDKVNSGQAKISFSKIVFSSMDNSQLSDMQVKALTAIAPQEVVVSSPETTLDTNSGETRIRATGTNEKLADGVYVKTYGVFAKDDTGSEILYGVTVSPNPNYFPAYDGVTPQAVTYSYKTVIQETSNITMTNSNDVYASQEDLTESLQPYAKTVDVNQQLDKKVTDNHDGTIEVNGSSITPADDSAVVHYSAVPNSLLRSYLTSGTDLNTITNPGIFPFNQCTFVNDINSTVKWGAIINNVLPNQIVMQEMIIGNNQVYGYRIYNEGNNSWTSWLIPADDSKVVHSTDMRKPANDVAGIEEVNTKQDKIGYTPADDSKVVHSTDMRKPASDVAGIEEVNAKQDKIGYTPADDSKVVHNSGDETIGGTKTFTNPIKGTIDGITYRYSAVGDDLNTSYMNDSVIFVNTNKVANAPAGTDGTWAIVRNYNSNATNGAQSYYDTNHGELYFRTRNNNTEYSPWIQVADDSKVAHLSGANNFDTVPTVNNNPLLLASSLPSDLARTGSNQEFTGKNTFDTAPIDKTTGNPYITKDGVPSDVARTGQANTFSLPQTFSQGIKTLQTGSYADANSLVNEGLYLNTNLSIKNAAGSITGGFIQVLSGGVWERVRQFMYSDLANNLAYTRVSSDNGSTWSNWVQIITSDQIPTDLATKSDVTTAVSSATANMVDSTKATNFTAGLQSGGVDVATAADLKSVADKAWYQLDNKYIVPASGYTLGPTNTLLYKIDDSTHTLYLSGSIALTDDGASNVPVTVQLGSIIKSISTLSVPYFGYDGISPNWTFGYAHNNNSTNLTFFPLNGVLGIASNAGKTGGYAFVHYGELV
ncbi:pyocin knob domain-containing protein [Levilactobacillus brevis]|uniref:pyocin knob domain-containing protein n=1 Tax=Levilactobacillus brevis TaxID=1580 RepID=UPI0021A31309|nr:pyocin knob domain-containing protein [Levilactobacillus brevis]